MSVKIMGAVWDADLPRPEKLVLLSYADHAAHDGSSIYPSVGRMAWKTGYTRRSIQKITRKLENKGILVQVGTKGSGVKEYWLNVSKLPERASYNWGENSSPQESGEGAKILQGGAKILQGGAKKSTGGGENSSPKPSLTVNDTSHDTKEKPQVGNQEDELARYNLTGEAWHKKHGGEISKKTKGPQRHPDPIGEIKQALENYLARDKDTPEEAVAKKYCEQTGIKFDAMPEQKRESLVRKWKNIIDNWGGANKEQALLAWKKWREKYDWKEPQVYYTNFENEYGELLQAVKDGNVAENVFKGFI